MPDFCPKGLLILIKTKNMISTKFFLTILFLFVILKTQSQDLIMDLHEGFKAQKFASSQSKLCILLMIQT